MTGLPRYRHKGLTDLLHLVLDPLIRDCVAIAHPRDTLMFQPVELNGSGPARLDPEGVER